jgi:hypothetical protein
VEFQTKLGLLKQLKLGVKMIYYNIIDNKKVFFESDIIFADYEAKVANTEEQKEYYFEKAKTLKLAEIKQVKDIKLYEPVFYMNKYFVASEIASSNIMGSILLDENTIWLDIDGNPINMTKQQMIELANAIKNQRGKIYFTEAQQNKAVENAKTIDDIKKIIVNY